MRCGYIYQKERNPPYISHPWRGLEYWKQAGQRGWRWVGEWWYKAPEDATEEASPELGSKQLLLTVEASLNQLPSLSCAKHYDCSCLAGCFRPSLIPRQAGLLPSALCPWGPYSVPKLRGLRLNRTGHPGGPISSSLRNSVLYKTL